jgi:hypothetical protein
VGLAVVGVADGLPGVTVGPAVVGAPVVGLAVLGAAVVGHLGSGAGREGTADLECPQGVSGTISGECGDTLGIKVKGSGQGAGNCRCVLSRRKGFPGQGSRYGSCLTLRRGSRTVRRSARTCRGSRTVQRSARTCGWSRAIQRSARTCRGSRTVQRSGTRGSRTDQRCDRSRENRTVFRTTRTCRTALQTRFGTVRRIARRNATRLDTRGGRA